MKLKKQHDKAKLELTKLHKLITDKIEELDDKSVSKPVIRRLIVQQYAVRLILETHFDYHNNNQNNGLEQACMLGDVFASS